MCNYMFSLQCIHQTMYSFTLIGVYRYIYISDPIKKRTILNLLPYQHFSKCITPLLISWNSNITTI